MRPAPGRKALITEKGMKKAPRRMLESLSLCLRATFSKKCTLAVFIVAMPAVPGTAAFFRALIILKRVLLHGLAFDRLPVFHRCFPAFKFGFRFAGIRTSHDVLLSGHKNTALADGWIYDSVVYSSKPFGNALLNAAVRSRTTSSRSSGSITSSSFPLTKSS